MQLEPIKALNYVQRSPVGIAGLIVPWNLPLYLVLLMHSLHEQAVSSSASKWLRR
jgi:hypothetical protein